MSARDELVKYAASTRTVTADGIAPYLDACDAETLREAAALVVSHTGNPLDSNAKMLRAAADAKAELDPEFPSTWQGGHALIVEYGDCELYGRCQCGTRFGMVTPDKPLDSFALPWERHVMTEVGR